MENKFKRFLSLVLAMVMVFGMMPATVFATETTPITGTITEDTVWNDGDVIGGVTIQGDVTITVNGTVTVAGTIHMGNGSVHTVTIEGGSADAKLIRGGDFTGQMFYAEGVSGNFQTLNFKNITLDGGAVWTGDVDATLNRGTTNSGVKAAGSVLYLVYANAVLTDSVLQNHDDSTGEKANAVFLRYYSTIEFKDSVVKNNNSISSYYSGGVVTVRQGGTVKTDNAEVYGNAGPQGGFFGTSSTGSYGGIVEVYNSKFHNNYSDAGAVFDMQCNSKIGYLKIDGCEFYDNASKRGLIYEHANSRPVIISNSSFHDNACAVWDCHADPVLDLSGKIVITEDSNHTKYLFETPLVLTETLADGSSIAMSDVSMNQLVDNFAYLVTGTAEYTVADSDLEKFVLPEGKKLIVVDANFDTLLDLVPVSEDFVETEINITLKDSLNEEASETRTVLAGVKYKPICIFVHDGFAFTNWKNENNKAVYGPIAFDSDAVMTAQWKLANPAVKLSRTDATLQATVTNAGEDITYTYQWYKDNVAIEGATEATYTMTDFVSHKYKCEVTASFDGYKNATGSADGNFSVPAAAQVGETKYATLSEAVKAANDLGNAIVTMLENVTLGEKLTISGNVTIEGAYTITRAADYTGTLFEVQAGAELTLGGGLVIDGGNEWTFDEEGYEKALEEGTGHDGFAFAIAEEGTPVATKDMIVVNGSVVVNKATIQNHMGNSYCNPFDVTGSLTLNNGALITHNAVAHDSSVMYIGSGTVTINDGVTITGNYGARNGGISRNDNGAIIMNGGEIVDNYSVNTHGCVFMMYGTNSNFIMNGGMICGNSSTAGTANSSGGTIYLHANASMTMNGGSICHNDGQIYGGIMRKNNTSSLTITDGYIGDNVSHSGNANADVFAPSNTQISGGLFTQDVTGYCADGYVAVLQYHEELGKELYAVVEKTDVEVTVTVNDVTYVAGNPVPTEFSYTTDVECPALDITYTVDGTTINATVAEMDGYKFTVVPGTLTVLEAVVAIGDVNYASLADAVNSVAKGAGETTIKLLVDELKLSSTQFVGKSYVQNIIIDLNGGTLTSNTTTLISYRAGTVLTIQNGTVIGNSKAGGSVRVTYGGTLVLGEGVKIGAKNSNAIKIDSKGTVRIDSNVEVDGPTNWLVVADNAENYVYVSAGNFSGAMEIGASANMYLSGGFYDVEPKQEWCADGYEVKRHGKDMWTIAPVDSVITVNGQWFDSWDEAESAFTKDCVIMLYGNVFNTGDCKALAGKGNVTLELNGFTLSTPDKGLNSIWVSNNTVLNVIDSFGRGKVAMGGFSYPLTAYTNGKVVFAEGVQFTGSMQSSNGSGSFVFGEKELLGANGVYQTNGKTARVEVQQNGDWKVSIGTLTLTAEDDTLKNNTLTISKNVSIDLNGNDLTAKNITVYGNLIDSADGVGTVTAEKLWFNGHNNGGYMPLNDEEVGGYRLYATVLDNRGVRKVDNSTVKAGFTVRFNKVEAYDLLIKAVMNGTIVGYASFTESGVVDENDFSANNIINHLTKARNQLSDGATVTNALTRTINLTTNSVDVFAELFSGETNVVIASESINYTK